MTNEEAIQEIINLANSLQIIQSTPTGQAVLMAIKSLEAWERVVEDIKTSQESLFCTEGEKQGLDVAKMIIDKYLKEVENDS